MELCLTQWLFLVLNQSKQDGPCNVYVADVDNGIMLTKESPDLEYACYRFVLCCDHLLIYTASASTWYYT